MNTDNINCPVCNLSCTTNSFSLGSGSSTISSCDKDCYKIFYIDSALEYEQLILNIDDQKYDIFTQGTNYSTTIRSLNKSNYYSKIFEYYGMRIIPVLVKINNLEQFHHKINTLKVFG